MTFDLRDRDTMFASLPKGGVGAEIGVDWGEFSKDIIRFAAPRLMYLVDCWIDQPVEVYGHDPANSQQDIKYRQCLQRFLTNEKVRMVKGFSLEVAPLFPDEYFDWLYIDANHLLAYQDAVAWWPKVKVGGWMMGHDYVPGGLGDYITVKADIDRFAAEKRLPMLLTDDPIFKNWIIQRV